MSRSLPDDINALKRLLAEQEALNRALQEKLNEREREIDHLQAQLDKLRRMNFGSRSEKVSRRIAQMEADLKAAQPERVFITPSGCSREVVGEVRSYLKELNVFCEILETRAGGVISSHCGPGTLGVLFIAK